MDCVRVIDMDYKCSITNSNGDNETLSIPNSVTFYAQSIEIITKPNEPSFVQLPADIFLRFPFLNNLTIESQIEEIRSDDFKHLKFISYFSLASNKLRKLAAETFQTPGSFMILNFQNNEIDTIDDLTFVNQSFLKELWLDRNKLTVIKRSTFAGLSGLNKLNLSENGIRAIEDGALNLPSLKELDLHGNKLKSLNDNIFRSLVALELISLSNNQIESIQNSLYGLKFIHDVDLSENRINDIDILKFAELRTLKRLGLRRTGVRFDGVKIDPSLSFGSPLEYLDLRHNNLTGADLDVLRIFPKLNELEFSFHFRSSSSSSG